MAYKNTLKGSINKVLFEKFKFLNIEKTKQDRIYSLSYKIKSIKNNKITNNPREMSFEDFYKYVEDFYVDDYYIYRGNIENDLVVFKTYKADMEISLTKDIFLVNCFSILIAVYAIMVAMSSNKTRAFIGKFKQAGLFKMFLREIENNNDLFKVAGAFTLMSILFVAFLIAIWNSKTYYPNRIKSVNNVIFTLEAIRKNVVEVPDPKECNLEVSIAEKGTPPSVHFVNVSEILEEKINESTIEDKSKSIEIKINL